VWAFALNQSWFVVSILVIGAFSYFFGVTLSLTAGILWSGILFLLSPYPLKITVTVGMVHFLGYVLVSLLGHRHKAEALQQSEQTILRSHENQMVPWAVANEVRTSLAAIRFLLFPLHDDTNYQELERATSELSRLERLFTEIEKKGTEIHDEDRTTHPRRSG
jgi:hypothetical protein